MNDTLSLTLHLARAWVTSHCVLAGLYIQLSTISYLHQVKPLAPPMTLYIGNVTGWATVHLGGTKGAEVLEAGLFYEITRGSELHPTL